MAKEYKTFVEVVELEQDKLMFVAVINKDQLKEVYGIFEPLSRSWRGQYQAMAKSIVDAYMTWKNKS